MPQWYTSILAKRYPCLDLLSSNHLGRICIAFKSNKYSQPASIEYYTFDTSLTVILLWFKIWASLGWSCGRSRVACGCLGHGLWSQAASVQILLHHFLAVYIEHTTEYLCIGFFCVKRDNHSSYLPKMMWGKVKHYVKIGLERERRKERKEKERKEEKGIPDNFQKMCSFPCWKSRYKLSFQHLTVFSKLRTPE